MGEGEISRGNWSGKLDFFLSCVGYAVGLGNVWRFPYLAYSNGGATFLIPYVIMLAVTGLPLFFLEMALGQFASEGPITVWKVSPIFTGIGFSMVLISGMVSVYYNVVIMYGIYYMMVSFVHLDDELPWQSCGKPWNTELCRTEPFPQLDNLNETDKMEIIYEDVVNETCTESILPIVNSLHNTTLNVADLNSTYLLDKEFEFSSWCKINWTTPASEYWSRNLLRMHESSGIGDLGEISLKLSLCLLVAWILIFFCLMKGVKSSGKVVYFTATFPYFILIVLLVRGVTLDGAWKGIKFYVVPEWNRLLEAKVWGEAATQIFYSLGVAFGGLLTMASYNKFRNNCHRDAVLVALINCGTSVFAGFAIFSLLGHMALQTNQEVEDVAAEGPGLAFEVYPEGLARLPVAPLWGFLFFFMILLLGLDSQFAMMETVISGVTDIFPHVLRKHKTIFTFACCMVGFFLGLPQVTRGGIYVLTLFVSYSGGLNLMVTALMEIICVMYVYGIRKFSDDIKMMLGSKPNPYWLVMWVVLTPLTILFIAAMTIYQSAPSQYDDYVFEDWAQGLGWLMASLPMFLIVLVAVIQACRYGWPDMYREKEDWGPALPEDRTGRYQPIIKQGMNDVTDAGTENFAYVPDKPVTSQKVGDVVGPVRSYPLSEWEPMESKMQFAMTHL